MIVIINYTVIDECESFGLFFYILDNLYNKTTQMAVRLLKWLLDYENLLVDNLWSESTDNWI